LRLNKHAQLARRKQIKGLLRQLCNLHLLSCLMNSQVNAYSYSWIFFHMQK
jgi:hypothetical protein